MYGEKTVARGLGGDRDFENSGIEVEKQTEMGSVMGKLSRTVEIVIKEFSGLEEQISPVLRNTPERGDASKTATPEFNSALAQDVNSYVRKLEYLAEHIRETRNRVEL